MKKINLYYLALSLFLFSTACKKTTPDVVTIPPSEKDKITSVTWKFNSFIADGQNVSQIYPGAILSIKQNGNNLEMISLQNQYTALPITASTSITGLGNPSFKDIPSSDKIYNYIKSLSIKNQSFSYAYTEDEFKDYNLIKYFLSNNNDVKSIFENIGIKTSTRITKKHAVYFYSNNEKFSLDMNLPKKTELLSIADVEAINTGKNVYYIDGVGYGNNSLILAEADADFATLKNALKAVLEKRVLTEVQAQAMSNAKVTFYARAGGKESFIKIANTLDEVKSILPDFEAFNNAATSYPISYSLRSVKDFVMFNQSITLNVII
ncbi:hypothetical protein GJU39_08925 [Pedobacter petrophilus]|uniref:Thiol-activated cytolysin n=1 Tax=Pedobacter petrophilus TaxID=1908241 RepID=A0A7K0FXP7_9SPHI|nr:thiol-activated cytolysin family protein [Pedobacter petrophilus]MRX76211.1 hypothetical protein [Pedobacter petrophilus]